ncbi:hypothetical protein PIB30_039212 [Stylosanthes scabra]|uniref:Uncharacterized protein n=1 Tax=Stylosanthes scabra TaxID=79078 RepID=A0ABU6REC7_9FABA|nr:hypothetical protein [Stylosanthes scabra]
MLKFFSIFSLSWVFSWQYQYGKSESDHPKALPILQRHAYAKWWSQFDSSMAYPEKKLLLDGRNTNADNLLLEDKREDSWHHRLNGRQESAQRLTCVEDDNSEGKIYLEGTAKFSDVSSISPGIQCTDLTDTDVTVPEFDGFIIPTDNTHPCTTGDQIEFEKMNPLGNSVDYLSLGKSRFMHSPFCYSSTPCKLHTIPGLCQSLPNGLLEGMNLRTSLPQNDESTRALSDCLPNIKVQYTPSIQTLWDKINAYGSSGKRSSLKLELPCISEENENVDEVADTSQKGIGSEGMTSSITLEPLADIMDSAKPSTAALQDDILTEGSTYFVDSQLNFSGTHNKAKKKLDKQDSNKRRFKSKGKENQSVPLVANGAKRTTESLSRPSRSKLSVKDSKRDVKVKALEAAEAAKRMAENKENERKMKKEALRIEREKLEQHNQSISATDKIKESCPAYSKAVSGGANKEMVMGNLIKAAEDDAFINEHPFQEQSYDISPYKGLDDEDEDENDKPNNKFIPSWARFVIVLVFGLSSSINFIAALVNEMALV